MEVEAAAAVDGNLGSDGEKGTAVGAEVEEAEAEVGATLGSSSFSKFLFDLTFFTRVFTL